MGFPDMAAVQLLWTRLHCLCCCWKGTTMKFVYKFLKGLSNSDIAYAFPKKY